MIDRAAIQNNEDILVRPTLQHFGDQGPIEIGYVDECVGQPTPDLGYPPSGLGFAGNVLGDLAQMYRLGKNQADNDPDPIGDPFQVRFGMNATQLRKHAGVQFLTDAHEIGFSVWCGNHRLCQFHEHFAKC